jgi:hypothetical protein
MVSSTRQAVAGILVVFTIAVSTYAQTTPVKDPPATITGKVTLKGKGVAGVVIALRKNNESYGPESYNLRGVTDSDGEYRIADVPAGNYQIIPSAPGFACSVDRNGQNLIVNKGDTIENMDFTLRPGGVITGKVVDPDGRPIIEEEVSAIPQQDKNRRVSFPSSVLTDDRGVYRIFGLTPNTYKVSIGRDTGSFFGGSRISYRRTYYPGTPDAAQATNIDVTEGSETTNIDITVNRTLMTYTASGRIVDAATGQPLPNLNYGITYFIDSSSRSSWNNRTPSTARGEFKFDNLVPGKYAVSIIADKDSNWRSDQMTFEIVDQDVSNLVIKATRGNSISGVLVVEGVDDKAILDRLSRMGVSASVAGSGDDSTWSGQSVMSTGGRFTIMGLRSGLVTFYLPRRDSFRILRVEYNGAVQPARGFELKEGQQLEGVRIILQYANASLHGAIEIENGPLPENARVAVTLKAPGDDRMGSDNFAQVDARGQFMMEGLVPGNYELTVGAYIPGAPPLVINKKQDVVVTAGSPTNVTVKIDLKSNTPGPE